MGKYSKIYNYSSKQTGRGHKKRVNRRMRRGYFNKYGKTSSVKYN